MFAWFENIESILILSSNKFFILIQQILCNISLTFNFYATASKLYFWIPSQFQTMYPTFPYCVNTVPSQSYNTTFQHLETKNQSLNTNNLIWDPVVAMNCLSIQGTSSLRNPRENEGTRESDLKTQLLGVLMLLLEKRDQKRKWLIVKKGGMENKFWP